MRNFLFLGRPPGQGQVAEGLEGGNRRRSGRSTSNLKKFLRQEVDGGWGLIQSTFFEPSALAPI